MSDNDKQLEELHPDLQLRRDIEAGKITQSEVEAIWKATSDLSPQTPITVRRAVLLMREVTKGKEPMEAMALNWPFFTQEVMRACTEMQAALMRDESRFSHLVAGTETIVKELQKIETLNRQFDHINAQLETIASSLRVLLVRPKPISLIRWQRRKKGGDANESPTRTRGDVTSGSGERIRYCEDCGYGFIERDYGTTCPRCAKTVEEPIPDPDQAANEARRFSIGSAWAKETDKGPLYEWRCPYFVDCQYIYYSGITDAHVTSQFRCPIHNLTLTRWLP